MTITTTDTAMLHSKELGFIRPSDIADLSEATELRCTDGIYRPCIIKTTIASLQRLCLSDGTILDINYDAQLQTMHKWEYLDDIRRGVRLKRVCPTKDFMVAPFENTVSLDDLTYTGTGNFRVCNKPFAEFSGRFVRSSRSLKSGGVNMTKPSFQCKKYYGNAELCEVVKNQVHIKPSWFLELLETFYGSPKDGPHYIPEEIILSAPVSWLSAFIQGYSTSKERSATKELFDKDIQLSLSNIYLRLGEPRAYNYVGNYTLIQFNIGDIKQCIQTGEEINPVKTYEITIISGDYNGGLWLSGYGLK